MRNKPGVETRDMIKRYLSSHVLTVNGCVMIEWCNGDKVMSCATLLVGGR